MSKSNILDRSLKF